MKLLFVQCQNQISAVRKLVKVGVKRKTMRRMETEFLNICGMARRVQRQAEEVEVKLLEPSNPEQALHLGSKGKNGPEMGTGGVSSSRLKACLNSTGEASCNKELCSLKSFNKL